MGVLNFLNSADSSRSCAAACDRENKGCQYCVVKQGGGLWEMQHVPFTSKAVTFVGLSEGLCVCPSRPNEFRLALTSPSALLTTETACGAYSFMESTDATSIPTPSQSALRMSICRWNFTRNWVCATPAVCESASSPFANDAGRGVQRPPVAERFVPFRVQVELSLDAVGVALQERVFQEGRHGGAVRRDGRAGGRTPEFDVQDVRQTRQP